MRSPPAFQTLDIVLHVLTACAGTSGGDGIGCLNQTGYDGLRLNVAMVGGDGVNHQLVLLVAASQIYADLHMAAFDLVVNSLAQVMEQTGTLGSGHIGAQFGGQQAGDMGDFDGNGSARSDRNWCGNASGQAA